MNLRWNNEREILLDYSHSSTGSEVRSLNALTSGSLVLSQKAYMKEIRSIFPIMIGEVFNIHSLYQNMTDCLQVSGILIKDSSLFFTATTIISNTTWCSTSQSCTFFFFFFSASEEMERVERSILPRHEWSIMTGTFESQE